MKKEMVDWYSERHYQPHKLIVKGIKNGFPQHMTEAAMIHCYNKIVFEKKKILDIDVARYIKNVCRDVDTRQREIELQLLYDSKDRLDRYKNVVAGVCVATALIHLLLTVFYVAING